MANMTACREKSPPEAVYPGKVRPVAEEQKDGESGYARRVRTCRACGRRYSSVEIDLQGRVIADTKHRQRKSRPAVKARDSSDVSVD